MGLVEDTVIRPSGEDAFVIEFGDTIDPAVGQRVAALTAAIEAAGVEGVREIVPTFRSVLVLFDPDATAEAEILAAVEGSDTASTSVTSRDWRLPVCLDGDAAEDLAEAADALGLGEDEVREALIGATYQVGMFGFAPGFAYLSGVDERLAIPRRPQPRAPMPEGSLIIAGGMAALTSISMPTGWYVVGRTAITLFRPDEEEMVPFGVGDTIRLERVGPQTLRELASEPDGGLARDGS